MQPCDNYADLFCTVATTYMSYMLNSPTLLIPKGAELLWRAQRSNQLSQLPVAPSAQLVEVASNVVAGGSFALIGDPMLTKLTLSGAISLLNDFTQRFENVLKIQVDPNIKYILVSVDMSISSDASDILRRATRLVRKEITKLTTPEEESLLTTNNNLPNSTTAADSTDAPFDIHSPILVRDYTSLLFDLQEAVHQLLSLSSWSSQKDDPRQITMQTIVATYQKKSHLVLVLENFDAYIHHTDRQKLLYSLAELKSISSRFTFVVTTAKYNAFENLERRVASRFPHDNKHLLIPSLQYEKFIDDIVMSVFTLPTEWELCSHFVPAVTRPASHASPFWADFAKRFNASVVRSQQTIHICFFFY